MNHFIQVIAALAVTETIAALICTEGQGNGISGLMRSNENAPEC